MENLLKTVGLLKTGHEMMNIIVIKKRYFVKVWVEAHEGRAHNDRWHIPAGFETREVSKETYRKSSYKVRIDEEKIKVSFNDFTSYWEEEFKNAILRFERDKSLANIRSARFAVEQYGYIFDVKCRGFKFVNEKYTDILLVAKKAEREAINEILKILEKKEKYYEKKAEKQKAKSRTH